MLGEWEVDWEGPGVCVELRTVSRSRSTGRNWLCSDQTLVYYVNLIIVQCDPATTCNGHGTCQEDGSCKCSYGFYGDSCSSKSISFMLVLCRLDSLELKNVNLLFTEGIA